MILFFRVIVVLWELLSSLGLIYVGMQKYLWLTKRNFNNHHSKVSFKFVNFLMCYKSRIEVQKVCKVVSNISKFCTFVLINRNCDIETSKWKGPWHKCNHSKGLLNLLLHSVFSLFTQLLLMIFHSCSSIIGTFFMFLFCIFFLGLKFSFFL